MGIVIIKYMVGGETVGTLVFADQPIGYHALGGVDPGPEPADGKGGIPCTVVTDGERREEVWDGFVHPDDILNTWHVTGPPE